MFISLSVFFAINITGYRIHGLKIFSLFLPSGTCSPLYFLIVLIEFISYFFRPISLFIRLFANGYGWPCTDKSYSGIRVRPYGSWWYSVYSLLYSSINSFTFICFRIVCCSYSIICVLFACLYLY